MVSADEGYSSEQGRAEVCDLGVKVVSISGAKGKRITGPEQWQRQAYRSARAERNAIESLMFTLKRGLEFGELRRRTQENVFAELLEEVLGYNLCQIIRVRKKLSEAAACRRAAA